MKLLRQKWLAPIYIGLSLSQLLIASPRGDWASILMAQKEYARVVFFLKEKATSFEEKMILAKAYSALGENESALRLYRSLYDAAPKDMQRDLLNEIFFAHLSLNDVGSAAHTYQELKNLDANVLAKVHYALGRALFVRNRYDDARLYLGRVGQNNPFSMRAQYLLGTMETQKKNEHASKIFQAINSMPLLSTEDYSVKQLSLLATARLKQEQGQHYEAGRLYQEIQKGTLFGDLALMESIEGYLKLSQEISTGQNAVRPMIAEERPKEASRALQEAVKLLDEYQQNNAIDWTKPKLFLLMIRVLEKSDRYNDARLAADYLVKYFSSIESEYLLEGFAEHLKKQLDLENEKINVFPYLPTDMKNSLPIITTLLEMRQTILTNRDKLSVIKQQAKSFDLGNAHNKLAELSENQRRIEGAYYREIGRIAIDVRRQIRAKVREIVKEAQFLRAEITLKEYARNKAKLDALRTYNAQRFKEFEESVLDGAQ